MTETSTVEERVAEHEVVQRQLKYDPLAAFHNSWRVYFSAFLVRSYLNPPKNEEEYKEVMMQIMYAHHVYGDIIEYNTYMTATNLIADIQESPKVKLNSQVSKVLKVIEKSFRNLAETAYSVSQIGAVSYFNEMLPQSRHPEIPVMPDDWMFYKPLPNQISRAEWEEEKSKEI